MTSERHEGRSRSCESCANFKEPRTTLGSFLHGAAQLLVPSVAGAIITAIWLLSGLTERINYIDDTLKETKGSITTMRGELLELSRLGERLETRLDDQVPQPQARRPSGSRQPMSVPNNEGG
jgi:hypothetical protein